ncbi:MAG TPA: hypothetical protein VNP96_11125 [Solirubrobacterales bacterium]|nr:hypothetical protein [Solirubrobacterales bacterium]
MNDRAEVLQTLATQLRDEATPISPHVVDPAEPSADGLAVESVREGYLLHYGESRLLRGNDDDLALLAGDYLYALGLERLAAAGDVEAVRILADLISSCAQFHTEGREAEVPALWQAAADAIEAP